MSLAITVLGCDGIHAGPGGACSGYLVSSDEATVWLDCGPGSFANLQIHVPLTEIDAIVCSHEHPDHWGELPVVRNAARYVMGIEGLRLYFTSGTAKLLRSISGELEPTFAVNVIDESSVVDIGDQRWEFSRTAHPVETMACRVSSGGKSLLYSADTGDAWDASSVPPVDLALFEATLDEDEAGTFEHLTAREAGVKARSAGASRLLITHLRPGADPDERRALAEAGFGGRVEVAANGNRYEI